MNDRLEKLRRLITHDGTPEAERCAALKRLESAIGGGDAPIGASAQSLITRSVRIGHRRRPTAIDEFTRLELYTADHSYGDVIRDIHMACQACNAFPTGVDFGFHQSDEAVVAIRFHTGGDADPLDLQREIQNRWPQARVTRTTHNNDTERALLLYLGVHRRSDAEELSDADDR